jgi:propionyl-CoA carboxylase alpha chain
MSGRDPMFKNLLVANRGEIALRVMRTCRRLGIATTVVYSEPDARSPHVKEADAAVALGGSTAAESYLAQENVIAAAVRAGCDAVHPGYGFLSENSVFARAVVDAGLVFIGPPPTVIARMGDKLAAKRLAAQVGVATVPGHPAALPDAAAAIEAARLVGFPVLIKPAAGGGGKGMRVVTEPAGMTAALAAAQGEARKAFGDDRVFVERYISEPRHVEIQILADGAGNTIHLGERECSIQRRHQKIIEEAPSVAVNPALRERMGAAACALARAAGYVSAGTVEFMLDADGVFYFLEMNTRLQVEHAVTEMITGLDLVELQLCIAAGEGLPLRQGDVRFTGWAIEARICAEDPDRGFAPSTGVITRYEPPRGGDLRVDSGVEAGTRVSVYYDSLLAKVVAWGASREAARLRLVDALNGYHIEGLVTNIDFTNAVVNHPAFVEGALSTDFVARHMERAEAIPPPRERLHHMAIATVLVYHNRRHLEVESLRPSAPTVGGVRAAGAFRSYVVKAGEDVFQVRLRREPESSRWTLWLDEQTYDVVTPPFEFYRRRLALLIAGQRVRFRLTYEGNFIRAAYCGVRRTFEIYSPKEWALAAFMPAPAPPADGDDLVCPMPGLVVEVPVGVGDRVYPGQVLVVLESMKMESGVASSRDGEIGAVLIEKGQAVDAGDVLMRFAPVARSDAAR